MGEDNAVVAMSIEVREDDSTVFGGEGDRFLRVRGKSDHEGGEDGDPCAHAPMYHWILPVPGRMGAQSASPQGCVLGTKNLVARRVFHAAAVGAGVGDGDLLSGHGFGECVGDVVL